MKFNETDFFKWLRDNDVKRGSFVDNVKPFLDGRKPSSDEMEVLRATHSVFMQTRPATWEVFKLSDVLVDESANSEFCIPLCNVKPEFLERVKQLVGNSVICEINSGNFIAKIVNGRFYLTYQRIIGSRFICEVK